MSSRGDLIAALSRSLEQVRALASRVTPEQMRLPTPCASWDVRALLGHVVQDVRAYAQADGAGAVSPTGVDELEQGWQARLRAAAEDLVAAWGRPGALERTFILPMGEVPARLRLRQQITELTVHAWDLAHATGQEDDLDAELVEIALDFGRENLKPHFRGSEAEGRAFGPQLDPPPDASEYDQLACFFGRDPRARPAPAG